MGGLDLSFVNWEIISKFVVNGFWFSVQLTIVATIGGIIFGTILALMRLSGNKWLMVPAAFYVNGMRSIPLVMVILWFYLLVPTLIGRPIGAELSATITFIAFEAAYFSEIMRAGIQSIPRGQVYAGQALGMTYSQNMRLVVLPQAFRNMLPVLLTQTIILFQDTSLVYAIGAYDLLKGFTTAGKIYGRPEEAYILAAVVYFVICFGLSKLVHKLTIPLSKFLDKILGMLPDIKPISEYQKIAIAAVSAVGGVLLIIAGIVRYNSLESAVGRAALSVKGAWAIDGWAVTMLVVGGVIAAAAIDLLVKAWFRRAMLSR